MGTPERHFGRDTIEMKVCIDSMHGQKAYVGQAKPQIHLRCASQSTRASFVSASRSFSSFSSCSRARAHTHMCVSVLTQKIHEYRTQIPHVHLPRRSVHLPTPCPPLNAASNAIATFLQNTFLSIPLLGSGVETRLDTVGEAFGVLQR